MAVGNEGGGGLTNEPNVVPMIDILLVLLIIFMLVQPRVRKAIDLQLPQDTPTTQTPPPNTDQIVLEIAADGTYQINKQAVPEDGLSTRLHEIYDPRPDKIIFIKADGKVNYQAVIHAMDVARGSGVKVIGVAPEAKS
ncbi:MAG TPA: biopolymer transporter ExbD [Gemmatimonadaceae bacterium]|nr:biopolymer transporter ExbD [Gemmatimonadaceae bacterium]